MIEDRWTTLRHVVEAVAIVVAGLWAFYTFVYQEKLKPAADPAAIGLDIAMRGVSHTARFDIVGVTISFHNSGRTEVDIAADGFTIWGERFRPAITRRSQHDSSTYAFDRDLDVASKTTIRSVMELRGMAVGGNAANHIIMEPGDNEVIEQTIAIPHDAYDLLYARVIAVPVKTSQTAKLHVRVTHARDGSYWLAIPDSDGSEDDNDAFFAVPR